MLWRRAELNRCYSRILPFMHLGMTIREGKTRCVIMSARGAVQPFLVAVSVKIAKWQELSVVNRVFMLIKKQEDRRGPGSGYRMDRTQGGYGLQNITIPIDSRVYGRPHEAVQRVAAIARDNLTLLQKGRFVGRAAKDLFATPNRER